MVLSPGDCNCCGEVGRVVFLVAERDGTLFLACNGCFAASEPFAFKEYWTADGHTGIEAFAPHGMRPATEHDLKAAGVSLSGVRQLDDGEFDLFH
jgi:hypothetical protein